MGESRDIAKHLIDLVPRTMWLVRREIRAHAKGEVTMPQFRVLAHLARGFQLTSELAELQGISLPAMSNIIDGMVRRGLVERNPSQEDRRHIPLRLTKNGKDIFSKLNRLVLQKLTHLLEKIDSREREELERGLQIWDRVLLPGEK